VSSSINIRAENGRVVNNVNIDHYISGLPNHKSTQNFSTQNASGSTSQAASIVESVNSGCRVLLMDEDTCATNFMFRDEKMKALISDGDEPIKTFIQSITSLYEQSGVSTVIVMGAIGEFFHYANEVIGLKNYKPIVLTTQATEIAKTYGAKPTNPLAEPLKLEERKFIPNYHILGEGKVKIKVRLFSRIEIGPLGVDVSGLYQLVSEDQLRMLGYLIQELLKLERPLGVAELSKFLVNKNNEEFAMVKPYRGDLAQVRLVDLWAVLNRLPRIEVVK